MRLFGSRALWSISIPLLFAEISEIVLHVTDTLFLSRVGITELGAVGLADSAVELALVLSLGLIDGIQILTARQIGRGRPGLAVRTFNLGLGLTVGLSAVLAALLWVNAGTLSGWLVESETVGRAVEEFLRIACFGIPFTVACFAYSALLVGFGRTGILVPATLLLTATNALLDYIFIFGKLGFEPMGIRGAALGSVLAEIATCAFLTIYLWRRPEARRYGLFRITHWPPKLVARLVKLSGPISAQGVVEALRWFIFFLVLERVGAVTLAIGSVVYVCYSVLRIPTEAFGETTCSMVARLIGRNRTDRIDTVVHQAIWAAGVVTLPLIIAAIVAPGWVLSAFSLESDLLAAGSASLRVVAAAMLIVIPAEMWLTALLGTGDTLAALGIEVALTVVMIAASCVAAFALSGSVALIWSSLALGWLVTLVASWAWMRSGAWKRLAL
ncbi:MAG: MATE family efflux transporter [Candidatus Eiseniibacteriota bacterium]